MYVFPYFMEDDYYFIQLLFYYIHYHEVMIYYILFYTFSIISFLYVLLYDNYVGGILLFIIMGCYLLYLLFITLLRSLF